MKNNKILVVEDDPDIAEIIYTVLRAEDYDVRVLLDGRDIKEHIKEFYPNLILMDLSIPGIDGLELIKILKKDTKTKKIPIIIVSARNALKKAVLSVKAQDFLPKPFDIAELITKVKKLI